MNKIIYVDVSNIPENEISDYIKETICKHNNITYETPETPKKSKIKKWLDNIIGALGYWI